jgi:uncharacterized membrane protein
MDNLTELTFFGLGAVPIVYWLINHARRNKVITDDRVAFLAPGVMWGALVALFALAPLVGKAVFLALGGWAATLLFKSGAKDNERV